MQPEEVLRGKVCLITGASRALGAEIARTLARCGAKIAVNYRQSADAAHALCAELSARGGTAIPLQADVSLPEDVSRLVATTWETLGPIDVLVNNAGPYGETPFLDLSVADFDQIMAANVRATFLVTQAAGRHMKARGQGYVINIAATDIFHRSHSVYGLAKSGVVYLTEALARELAPEVRVNAIAPDLIADNEGMDAVFVRQVVTATPLGRLVTRAEIAEMVCLLCTPAFDIVTGHTIVMDGGRSIPRIAMGPETGRVEAETDSAAPTGPEK
ncbi:MAG TPA: SDR family oxidoreductase [Chthonomonadaceae bacterium]|nr:SDR family oxidoreductase [Chthonomonadaceae bacterium]